MINYTFYLREDFNSNKTQIWNYSAKKCFSSFNEFDKIFEQMTDNYGAMVFKKISLDCHVFRYNTTNNIYAVDKIKQD